MFMKTNLKNKKHCQKTSSFVRVILSFYWFKWKVACMASPSRSFSALLNSSTASGLSSNYPGQVEGWVIKCTKKAYRFNEKQKAYLDAKFAIGQATGKKLDGDIFVRKWDVHSAQMVFAFSKSLSFTANLGFDKTLTPGQLTSYWPPTDPPTDPL